MAGLAAAAVQFAERPLTSRLTRYVQRNRFGLLQQRILPPAVETFLACLMMDYSLYLWHVLTHKVAVLWRFHRVHHADLDMDASTAVRFHFGEMVLSVGWRLGQIAMIGVSPRALSVWYALLLCEVMFHHSNVELPAGWERRLRRFIVTPQLHGIHHSVTPAEVNSNWSSGLTVWDMLHRTLCLAALRDEVTLGLPDVRDPTDVTLPRLVAMPFRRATLSDCFRTTELGCHGLRYSAAHGHVSRKFATGRRVRQPMAPRTLILRKTVLKQPLSDPPPWSGDQARA